MSDEHYWEKYREFIEAFAEMIGEDRNEAGAQWAGFSAQLPQKEIEAIELGGEQSGYQQGAFFNECFPSEDEEE